MKAGQNTKMLRGAVWACVLPVSLGLLALFFTITDDDDASFYAFVTIALCIIFGSMLVAWLACRRLKRINDHNRLKRWKTSAKTFLFCASCVHLIIAIISGIIVALILDSREGPVFTVTGPDFSDRSHFLNFFLWHEIRNVILWVLLTIPLSLICATVFWRVTKFPDDTSVF